jgi:hypothetical protein
LGVVVGCRSGARAAAPRHLRRFVGRWGTTAAKGLEFLKFILIKNLKNFQK